MRHQIWKTSYLLELLISTEFEEFERFSIFAADSSRITPA
jgi:hypothetical protein